MNVKQAIKSTLGYTLYRTGLHRPLWRGKAVVALFHRIDDRYPEDPITCTADQLRRFCVFAKRHFVVVPLSTLLDRMERGEDISRHLAITFDDGYRDNHAVAMPILREHGLPATFFITTNFIGTDHQTWWDSERRIRSEWMTWDDVRDLWKHGFEVAPHTETHPDLGVVPPDVAEAEIVGSRERLQRELGGVTPVFCYPFGRPEQITEENRAIVRRVGLRCCLSAHGGTLDGRSDPYRLKRTAMNAWFATTWQWGFETARMRP